MPVTKKKNSKKKMGVFSPNDLPRAITPADDTGF